MCFIFFVFHARIRNRRAQEAAGATIDGLVRYILLPISCGLVAAITPITSESFRPSIRNPALMRITTVKTDIIAAIIHGAYKVLGKITNDSMIIQKKVGPITNAPADEKVP